MQALIQYIYSMKIKYRFIFGFLCALCISCQPAGPKAADSRVTVVLIDDPALLARESYVRLVRALAPMQPLAIYLDVAFITPADSGDAFARDLHAGVPVYSGFYLHDKQPADWAAWDYGALLGNKLAGVAAPDAAGLWSYGGIELPEPAFSEASAGLVCPFLLTNGKGLVEFVGLYAYHRGYLLEHAALTLANSLLAPGQRKLALSADYLSLELQAPGKPARAVIERRGLSQPLGIELASVPFATLSAQDLLEGRAQVPKGSLVMIGAGAGLGDDRRISHGDMPGVLLLANAVNGLLWLAQE